jgi:hypothetical protein
MYKRAETWIGTQSLRVCEDRGESKRRGRWIDKMSSVSVRYTKSRKTAIPLTEAIHQARYILSQALDDSVPRPSSAESSELLLTYQASY